MSSLVTKLSNLMVMGTQDTLSSLVYKMLTPSPSDDAVTVKARKDIIELLDNPPPYLPDIFHYVNNGQLSHDPFTVTEYIHCARAMEQDCLNWDIDDYRRSVNEFQPIVDFTKADKEVLVKIFTEPTTVKSVHPIKVELIKVNNLPDGHESSIFASLPVPVCDMLDVWLTNQLSQQVFNFLHDNATILGIDSKVVELDSFSILDVKSLDEHKFAFEFGGGILLYNRVDNSVALHYSDQVNRHDMYFVYYPSKRQAYLDLGFEVSYYDPFTSEYKALFADISSIIDQLEYRLDLIKDSYID